MTARSRLLLNVAGFQAGWFACVLGAAAGMPWVGVAIAAVVVLSHVLLDDRAYGELAIAGCLTLVGIAWETVAMHSGLIDYVAATPGGIAPAWIVAMWPLFGTTLNGSLGFLRGRLAVQALFGGIGGPLAYWAGQRLGAVTLPEPVPALLLQAVGWAVLLPLSCRIAVRFSRPPEPVHV